MGLYLREVKYNSVHTSVSRAQ